MSARTPEELSDLVAADLIWRKKELTMLKRMLDTASADRHQVLVRSLLAILYAHWEGFIKNTAERYLEFLRVRRLAYRDLQSNFLAISLRERARRALQKRDPGDFTELIEVLRGDLEERSRIPREATIDTESNLSSSVLQSITKALGLPFDAFEAKAKLIDERLVGARNKVAHGEFLVVDAAGVMELFAEVQGMMEAFRTLVENAVVLGAYRRSA